MINEPKRYHFEGVKSLLTEHEKNDPPLETVNTCANLTCTIDFNHPVLVHLSAHASQLATVDS